MDSGNRLTKPRIERMLYVYFMSNMKQIHGNMNFNFKPVFNLVALSKYFSKDFKAGKSRK
jgi:hypothetical protein